MIGTHSSYVHAYETPPGTVKFNQNENIISFAKLYIIYYMCVLNVTQLQSSIWETKQEAHISH